MTDPHRTPAPGPATGDGFWIDTPAHRDWLLAQAADLFAFFRASPNPAGGFHTLDLAGRPLPSPVQELHTTTRLIHSYALGKLAGIDDGDDIIDHGMRFLWDRHRDTAHGGYLWSVDGSGPVDDRKLAYGHVFVLLAGASARMVGHPQADRLIDDATEVLDRHFWEDGPGLFADEFNRDWTPFSTYRGMNANMHAVEALVTAYEATGRAVYLDRAGRILSFFMGRVAPAHNWRLPEHYDADWRVDPHYSGNPMFRPAGTTPGHSFEMARLSLHYWDLAGRPDSDLPQIARRVMERALADAWDEARGGFVYTLGADGTPAILDRYWWPVTEALGALAAFLKLEREAGDERWYRMLWDFANDHLIDHRAGGWFPELADDGTPDARQFAGKPDIYHAVQAALFPLAPGLSRLATSLRQG